VKTLRNIEKKARAIVEETGVNVVYMSFGMIHWSESDSSSLTYQAPVLLLPVQISQESSIAPYSIIPTGDEAVLNPTFAYKVNMEHSIRLPEYVNGDLDTYLNSISDIVSRLNWTVTPDCKIGFFSFLKINMYRDLKDNASTILNNRNIRILLGESIPDDYESLEDKENTVKDPLIDLHCVVDADSSQIKAIEMAKSGKSFVLQGPPGTGKSQTITNIIAECLDDGKKVLFVSEKLAALDVVYNKLKQAGLDSFCLELHSHRANKKNVIDDICNTLRENKSHVSSKAKDEILIKQNAERQLNDYALELHKQQPVINLSLYQLYEKYASVSSTKDVDWMIQGLDSKGEKYFKETVSLIEQYVEYVPSIGYDFRRNPWFGYIGQDTSYQTVYNLNKALNSTILFLADIKQVINDFTSEYEVSCNGVDEVILWRDFFKLAASSKVITPSLLKTETLKNTYSTVIKMQEISKKLLNVKTGIAVDYDDGIYTINANLYHKKLVKQFESKLSRVMNSEYKEIINSIKNHKKDNEKVSYEEAVILTAKLSPCQSEMKQFEQYATEVHDQLGSAYDGISTDWEYFKNQYRILNSLIERGVSFGIIEELSDFGTETQEFMQIATNIDNVLEEYNSEAADFIDNNFSKKVFNIKEKPISYSLEKCKICLEEIDKLANWCRFRDLLSDLNDKKAAEFISNAITQNLETKYYVKSFEKQFYLQWINLIISHSQTLSSFNRISQDKAVNNFAEKDLEQFEINKAKILADLSAERPALDMISPGSELSLLLRESEKKRKQKSIRSLFKETGDLVQRIKPCFLMSPLSVSTFLEPDSVHFDVVVFDEASQIFPQDAVGAIYRANQLIVVGDSKQMPPSNFFTATIDDDADDDEETGDVSDFESILDLCSTSMPQLSLNWHYRSRCEQLIAFSNKNFYNSSLITFPSAEVNTFGMGVDYHHVDGLFDRKAHTNLKEAEYVVDLIYSNIKKYPNRSLGVVAFSVAQQNLIDSLLSKRRMEMPQYETYFNEEVEEPFFIKNLETVQGDERDIIIFSIAYGMDAQERLLQNFGPLNREGGERRLNVAVTRAKYNVQLVSSMHYTNIDLKRTSSEGARLLREYLDYAENGNIALERTATVNEFDQFDSDFEMEVCDLLREHGYSVDTQVGCSGFRIDLGLKRSNTSDYVLAIECDGATYHSSSNARDRDRLRQEILERMGWKFYRIWSTDWFKNKSVEIDRLLQVAEKAVNENSGTTPSVHVHDEVMSTGYEEITDEKNSCFSEYKTADIEELRKQYLPKDFQGMIKAILEIEAPLSEELLLRRIVGFFGREKVTGIVIKEYKDNMHDCNKIGIIRRNGFLYLENSTIKFRTPGDIFRDINQISPEELADGMKEILKQNGSVDKEGLFRTLAAQCGVTRLTKGISELLDNAFKTIESDITIDNENISLKN
jgi:superfamily I DNA and/or RNA helicase